MDINTARARQLMALAARIIRDHASDAEVSYDGTTCDGTCLADDLESEVEGSIDAAPVYREFRIQHDYNGKRAGEPDSWKWNDAGIRVPDDYEAARDFARNFVETRHESRFVRGYRLVERFSTSAIRVVEVLSEKPGLSVNNMAEGG